MKYVISLLIIIFSLLAKPVAATTDSILTPDGYRKYIIHLPAGYNPLVKYPLVLSFHGLNSDAAQQQFYSGFDVVADTGKFIVVYPQGL